MLSRGAIRILLCCLATMPMASLSAPPNESPGSAEHPKDHLDSMKDSVHGSFGLSEKVSIPCNSCHVGGIEQGADRPVPRWDPSTDTVQFQVFGGVSEVCLSCHDGMVAAAPPTSAGWRCCVFPGPQNGAAKAKHHPFAVPYGCRPNIDFLPLSEAEKGSINLFEAWDGSVSTKRVECASCHDPHHPENPKLLRVPSEQQQLCKCCHETQPELTRRVYLPMQRDMDVRGDCRSCHQK